MRKFNIVTVVNVAANRDGTYTVTLQLGFERVTCEDILIWDPAQADKFLFREWRELALEGEQGFTYSCR